MKQDNSTRCETGRKKKGRSDDTATPEAAGPLGDTLGKFEDGGVDNS